MSRPDVVHREPVWRDRADFLIGADLPEGPSEQLWSRRIGQRLFEVCCIPFFVYDVALGDVVLTDDDYTIERVEVPSGRLVFRAWLSPSAPVPPTLTDHLTGLGALLEWSSEHLIAIDTPDLATGKVVAEALAMLEARGVLTYEAGQT